MKKKLLITIIAVFAVITCAFGLVACKDDPPKTANADYSKYDGTYTFYSYVTTKDEWYYTGVTCTFDNGKYTMKYPETEFPMPSETKGEYKINKDGALEFTVNDTGYVNGGTVVCEYVEDGILKMSFEPNNTPVKKMYLCKDGLLPPNVSESEIHRDK